MAIQNTKATTPNSRAITDGIEVEAAAQFLEGRSFPEQRRWLYAYRVTLTNRGTVAQTLLRRHWCITDANGETREVRGEGVVGETPCLEPGESYEYRSMCDLATAWGTMEGTYTFADSDGVEREIEIARFFLVESAENAIVVE